MIAIFNEKMVEEVGMYSQRTTPKAWMGDRCVLKPDS
jgi:hypothetical protein